MTPWQPTCVVVCATPRAFTRKTQYEKMDTTVTQLLVRLFLLWWEGEGQRR